jgi:hypothetical protein
MRGVLVLLAVGACAPEVDASIPDLVPDPVTDEKGDLVFGDSVGYVITPAGLVHGSCVYNIGEDSVVQANEVTIDDSGRARLPPCRFPAQLSAHGDDELPSVDGWAEAAWWDAATTPTKLVATWTVPPPPKNDHGQIIYFFPSLEPTDSSAIVQPVLQWGPTPAGGSYSATS